MEGGAIDVNGRGTLLTTEECLLSDGPGPQPRARPRGASNGSSPITWACGTSSGSAGGSTATTPTATSTTWRGSSIPGRSSPSSSHAPTTRTTSPCEENRRRLAEARDQDGQPLRVVTLPMPEPVVFEGQRLPASYANFYIANGLVLVPTFNDPADREALDTLAALFPDREVVGIHAVDLVLGLGTLHCLSQQQPAPPER